MTKQTEAQKKAQQKFRESRATIQLVMTPNEREEIKATAADLGMSANAYILDVVRKDIRSDKSPEAGGSPIEASAWEGSILTPETLQNAQAAAQAAGEEVPAFLARAVKSQTKRDKMVRLMGHETEDE